MLPQLLIFCGLPGSGKTTIAALVAADLGRAVHIQTDGIRSMIGSQKYTSAESRFVYDSAMAVGREALRSGYHAILDGTFPREEYRLEAVRRLSGLCRSVTLVMTLCDPAIAYERNAARVNPVPWQSFMRLEMQFEAPKNAIILDTEKIAPRAAADEIVARLGRNLSSD